MSPPPFGTKNALREDRELVRRRFVKVMLAPLPGKVNT